MKFKKPEFIIVSCLSLLAFALRIYQLGGPSLWYDELLELDVVQGSWREIGPQLVRHAAMPLDYYLLSGWVQFGRQEAWVRFPALLFGTLTAPLIYKLAASLFNKRAGYTAALLLSVASIGVYYSQNARPYAMLMFWVLLSFWGLWRTYQTGRAQYWAVTILGLTGATLSHYFTLFLLFPMALWVGLQHLLHLRDKPFWQHIIYFAMALMVLIAVFAFNGRLRDLYNVGGRFSTVATQPETLTLPAAEKPNGGAGPPRHLGFVLTGILMPFGSADLISLSGYNALVVIALISLWLLQKRWVFFFLLSWFILPIVLIYLFLLQRGTFFAVRYILYTLPAYLILVAIGVEAVVQFLGQWCRPIHRNPARWLSLPAAGAAVALITVLLFGELAELEPHYRAEAREDWRAVGQLLQNNAQPDDAVIAVKAEPALNWYYPSARAPFGAYNTSQPIWQAIRQHPRRWVVLSSYSYKVDEGLRRWLAEQQAVTIAIDRRVVVYLQQDGLNVNQLLAQVRMFELPQKALTYAVLADQFKAQGELDSSREFYQKAVELAGTPTQKTDYQKRLSTLSMLP